MNYNVLFEAGTGKKAGKLSENPTAVENGKKDKGLAYLKKGQLITGKVVSVEEKVTLDFHGQKVTAPKNVFHNVIPGETKTFEVVKATDNKIELKPLDNDPGNRHSFMAAVIKDSDWDTIMSQKEQGARKAGKETEYKDVAGKLEEIGSKLTEKDCRHLEEEGFAPHDFTVSGLYHAVNRMKSKALSEDQNPAGKSAETIASFDKNSITARLKEENLPATEENFAKISKALDLSEAAVKIDDKAMQYLISRNLAPTIENIYKALYSGTTQNLPLSEEDFSELSGQAGEIIRAAGYEVNEENLMSARWLIENKLPLTIETFTYKKELEGIKSSTDKSTILDRILEGMSMGINPKDVSLLPQGSEGQILADIDSIQPEAITEAVNTGAELTIRNLKAIQESLKSSGNTGYQSSDTIIEEEQVKADIDESEIKSEAEDPSADQGSTEHGSTGIAGSGVTDSRFEEIKAKRQLEEIRLKMTLEAATLLEKKGIRVETQELGKVVEALRDLEDRYYKDIFKEADMEVAESSLQILKETTQSIDKLKYMPNSVLGNTLADRSLQTIPGLLSEGNKRKAELDKAGTAYETLMTVPNKEYGDSIRKAFANMDSLLSELKIGNTEENRRAVRILGYNRMEINEESIRQVKAYDLQVQTMIKNLHPAVTVRMIKEGINPLKLPINELNTVVDRIKEEQGITSEDKYSTFLQKLEKENGITDQERKAYIGVYRLLYNVEKSDGAALGAVIKAQREVTLDNLLTAVQTGKKGRMEAIVGDEFGTLQSTSRDKESIAEQLSSFSGDTGQQSKEQASKDNIIKEQTEYLNRILKQVKEELSPQKLKEVEKNLLQEAHNSAQAGITGVQAASSVPVQALQSGIWETVRNVPIEKLYEQLQSVKEEQPEEKEAYANKVQEIRELCKTSEQSIRFLNDYQVPSTPMNILIANHILSNGESPIKRLIKLQKENIVENTENSLQETNELSDKLIDKSSMEEAYGLLESETEAALNRACSQEKIDSFKLAELKSLGQQMTFIRTLAEKEYYQIPIETDKGITNMNLTIIRGTKTSGKVSVTIRSEQLGNVKADFSLKDRTLKGYIGSDSRSGLEQLQNSTGEIEAAAAESSITLKQLDFGLQNKVTDTYSYQNTNTEEKSSSMNSETERALYRLAKAIVLTVRAAENSGSDKDRAVS